MTRAEKYLGLSIFIIRTTPMTGGIRFPDTPGTISFRQVARSEIAEVARDPELQLSEAFVKEAIERDFDMFGAFDGPQMVAYVWRSRTVAPHTENLWVRVNPPYCYSFNAFTKPAYRGLRISPANHLHSDKAMAKLGYSHRIGFVSVRNYASVAMGKYMGSQPIGYAGFLTTFGRTVFIFRTPEVRKTGFEFYRVRSG